MRKWTFQIVITICFLIPSFASASGILNIVPSSSSSITFSSSGIASLYYTVTNNTSMPINNININPSYNISGSNPFTLTLQNDTCSNTTLNAKSSCSFAISMQGGGQIGTIALMPQVCGYNGAMCSVPLDTNRVSISSVNKTLYAFICNHTNNVVITCQVNNSGAFANCYQNSQTFNSLTDIAINSAGTIAYVLRVSQISACDISKAGQLSNCVSSSGNLNAAFGIALNQSNTIAYIANNNGGINNKGCVSECAINADGSIGTCTALNDTSFNLPSAITLNSTSTLAYVANFDGKLSICPINSDGSFGTCSVGSDPSFGGLDGIGFNSANNFLYLANAGLNYASICSLNSNGSLALCTTDTANGTFKFSGYASNLFASSPSNYGYFPNASTNSVSICPINTATGGLGTCTANTGNGLLRAPAAVTLALI